MFDSNFEAVVRIGIGRPVSDLVPGNRSVPRIFQKFYSFHT